MMGIQTIYKNCSFRSRLEAKWAAFFDLLEWKWEYEPFDLNGWIPDFILIGADMQTLVEIKPYTHGDEFSEVVKKVNKARKGTIYEKNEVLYLGCILPADGKSCPPSLGWLDDGFGIEFLPTAAFNRYGDWGFIHDINCYKDRMTGEYDGDHFVCPPKKEDVEILFNTAGTLTKWKGGGEIKC